MTHKIQKNLIARIAGFIFATIALITFMTCALQSFAAQDTGGTNTETECIKDDKGFCTVHTWHYEAPVFMLENGHRTFYIENESQWLHLAIAINEKQQIYRNGYYEYLPGGKFNVNLLDDLDFSDMTFIPMGRKRHEFYKDYRDRKLSEIKKSSDHCILVTGLFFLTVGIILTIIWYVNFYNVSP